MGLSKNFPVNPYEILEPDIRWFSGDESMGVDKRNLILPLVDKIRRGVYEWRKHNYEGASDTTKALLNFWFNEEHFIPNDKGQIFEFRYYFSQREAIESCIWLYEIEQAKDPYALLKYDSSGILTQGMFDEDWTRYLMKLATGAGKTKIMSLLVAWSYFHKKYEENSDLSTNFLIIAPNIIVLERLRTDFNGLKIFHEDPILPSNGYNGQNWQDDFQLTLHIQDEIGTISETGNIFLTNIHRVFLNQSTPTFEDENTLNYFLGERPTGKTNESQIDLGKIVRDVDSLVIINDEAHHIHDNMLAWFKNIQDISNQLRLKGSKLSAQFDLTATPKDQNGAIFPQTISDYPLVEAIRQGIVKTPVLPDEASRAKLNENQSDNYVERYEDYLHLGYLEWKNAYDELKQAGKKAVLFIMTDDTKDCDDVKVFLENKYPELKNAVLVIHTNKQGEISESTTKKESKEELEKLRKLSNEIDSWDSPYKAIVSVMMLREGWDVKNVTSIVGLRPYKSKSKVLPEQTLGRGLRLMFRGQNVKENVSVIGTEAFIEFVEAIKVEGVELEYAQMGQNSKNPKTPMVVEIDKEDKTKDIERLDIELPKLSDRIKREFKNIASLQIDNLDFKKLKVKYFSPEQQREIVFKSVDTDEKSHTTTMDKFFDPNYQNVVGYFTNKIMHDLRLVGGFDVLFEKIKRFIEKDLFENPINIEDLNILRNLSEVEVNRTIIETFKKAINELTVEDTGTTEIIGSIKFKDTRPFVINPQEVIMPVKSIFNRIAGDSHFELVFANKLDKFDDIISFVKNSQSTYFKIEYKNADGNIANYYPDFVVKETEHKIWIIETKGREDLDDIEKYKRLQQWCKDATEQVKTKEYKSMYIKEEVWDDYAQDIKTFRHLKNVFLGIKI